MLPDLLVFAWQPVLQNRNIFSWPPEHARETPFPCTLSLLSPCRATSWLIACILAIAIRAATATKTAVDLRSKRTVASCLPLYPLAGIFLLPFCCWPERGKNKTRFLKRNPCFALYLVAQREKSEERGLPRWIVALFCHLLLCFIH